jgi:hypothetical protein
MNSEIKKYIKNCVHCSIGYGRVFVVRTHQWGPPRRRCPLARNANNLHGSAVGTSHRARNKTFRMEIQPNARLVR